VRAPRYKFPDGVRTATRSFASRAVKAGAVPQTPAELHERILETPDLKRALEDGGYNEKFTADDLFPLYEIFVVQAGGFIGEPARPDAPARRGGRLALIGAVVALVLVALAFVILR
jgi:hypothetical protein